MPRITPETNPQTVERTDVSRCRAALLTAHIRFLGARTHLVRASFRLAEAEGRIDSSEREAFETRIRRAMRLSKPAKRLTGVQAACRGAEAYLHEARGSLMPGEANGCGEAARRAVRR